MKTPIARRTALTTTLGLAHPMHLHGHAFQVIAFDADNPGHWAFHCQNLYYMAIGMMTEFRYQGVAV